MNNNKEINVIKKIKDWFFVHHTENDVLNIQIIQGKNKSKIPHYHLIIRIRNIEDIFEKEYPNKEEIIQKINQFLEIFKNKDIDYDTDRQKLKEMMEDIK
ncbi:MAG: hypothetical protein AABY22_28650 [Nanoarchaeota archaeon]